MKHKKSTKSQKEYVKGTIQSLSLQRLTDQQIADYLQDEKNIEIARSTVTYIRNKVEKQAEKWYIELKQSSYKYIALYKERIDSLYSYQKRLHEIIEFYREEHVYPDTVIKAIHELHMIELSIYNLWKQLPEFDIVDTPKEKEEEIDEIPPIVDVEDVNGVQTIPPDRNPWIDWQQCDGCKRYWSSKPLLNYHRKTTHHYDDSTIPSKHDYPVL
jgi:hypothetical protein